MSISFLSLISFSVISVQKDIFSPMIAKFDINFHGLFLIYRSAPSVNEILLPLSSYGVFSSSSNNIFILQECSRYRSWNKSGVALIA